MSKLFSHIVGDQVVPREGDYNNITLRNDRLNLANSSRIDLVNLRTRKTKVYDFKRAWNFAFYFALQLVCPGLIVR